jgi:hypothetical protein
MARAQASAVPADGLLQPVVLAAIAVLLINDHVLKAAYPGPVTGKLSDFAGLLFFPLLIVATWEVFIGLSRRWRGPSARPLIVAAIATGSIFVAVKVSGEGSAAFAELLGRFQWLGGLSIAWISGGRTPTFSPAVVARDPTDLVALGALLGALVIGMRRIERGPMSVECDPE